MKIFTKRAFLESCERLPMLKSLFEEDIERNDGHTWVERCNGKEVVDGIIVGTCYEIPDSWTEEVEI